MKLLDGIASRKQTIVIGILFIILDMTSPCIDFRVSEEDNQLHYLVTKICDHYSSSGHPVYCILIVYAIVFTFCESPSFHFARH
jgi:hypothetical protein